jgi:protease I
MTKGLAGKSIAILCTNGVEQSEVTEPRDALEKACVMTDLVPPANTAKVQAVVYYSHRDVPLSLADRNDYDAPALPGRVANDHALRIRPEAVKFVRSFYESRKPIAAIGHGPWMVVEADVARGRTLAFWFSLEVDIRTAGGRWVDREVVHDGWLTTSRKPNDLPAFVREILKSFAGNP